MEDLDKKAEISIIEDQSTAVIDESTALFQNAVSFYENSDFQQAANLFKQIIDKYPENLDAYIYYGDCQIQLLNSQEAINYWNLAKEKNQFFIKPYISLGNYYSSQEDLIKAKDEYEEAFCIDPYNENNIINLGMIHEKLGNRKMAFLLYEFFLNNSLNISSSSYRIVHKKISMHKLNAISHMKLGVFFERKKFYRKSLQSFFESLRVFPNFSKTYINIGNIFFKFEKFDFAYLYWLEAFKIEKKKPSLCLNLGICSEKLGKRVDAYCFFTYFMQITSSSKESFEVRKKIQQIKSEISTNPDIVNSYIEEINGFIQKKEYETAIVMYENLFFLTKNNEYYKKLNELLSATNIINKAAKKAIEYAKYCNTQNDYKSAMEKAKVAKSLWDNTDISMAASEIMSSAQMSINKSIDDLVKSKLKEEEELKKQNENFT